MKSEMWGNVTPARPSGLLHTCFAPGSSFYFLFCSHLGKLLMRVVCSKVSAGMVKIE